MSSISTAISISEAIVYIAYVIYIIYRPIKMSSMRKMLSTKKTVIQNPPSVATSILPIVALLFCLPSILILFILSDDADLLGIFIYLAIFAFFIGLGLILLFSAKGDYYLDTDGIHFIRSDSVIRYCDIQKSKWYARHFTVNNMPVNSMTKMLANGRHIRIYNLSEEQYKKQITSKDIFVLVNKEIKTSLPHKAFIAFMVVAFICAGVVFMLFMTDSSKYGGSAINVPRSQALSYLLTHEEVPHYLANHGGSTAVSYSVWKHMLTLEVATLILMPLAVLCGLTNVIWYAISGNRTMCEK